MLNNNTQAIERVPIERLQMMSLSDAKSWYNDFVKFTKELLKENLDYGVVPGVEKPSLLKPGAEKLRLVYGLSIEITCTQATFELDRPYIDYTYKAVVKTPNGQVIAECEGNANSYETKFRYSYHTTSKKPSQEEADRLKAEGKGKWRKYNNQWVWSERTENPDVVGLKNNIMKIAQKRAFVGAVLMATGASEFFTQDVEDMPIDVVVAEVKPQATERTQSETEVNKTTSSGRCPVCFTTGKYHKPDCPNNPSNQNGSITDGELVDLPDQGE